MSHHLSPYEITDSLRFRMSHRKEILNQLQSSNRLRLKITDVTVLNCPQHLFIQCKVSLMPQQAEEP